MFTIENTPRFVYIAFAAYAIVVVITRWQASRVMTQDRRFLMLFFLMQSVTAITSGVLKTIAGVAPDASVWMTVLTQSFLAAYLHHSIPQSYKRAHHWITRRKRRET